VSEARSINRAEILTARTDATAEAAEAAAAEAAAEEAAAAVEAAAAAEAAAAGAAAKAAADALGARAALEPSCRKSLAAARAAWPRTPRRPPGDPCLAWGREELKTR
jgi:hypothetical protein